MSKRKPERFHSAWWEIREDEDEEHPVPYWYGYCEGDKDGDRQADGEPLVMFPDHFPIGTRIDVEEPEAPGFYDRVFADRGTPEAAARHYREKASAHLLKSLIELCDLVEGTPLGKTNLGLVTLMDARKAIAAATRNQDPRP